MPSTNCAADGVIACESLSGCRWYTAKSGTCTYPNHCTQNGTRCSAGCFYWPDTSFCGPPDGDYCKTFIAQDNCWSHGCEWSLDAGCSHPSDEDCQYRSESCTAENGCQLEVENTTGSCIYNINPPCGSLTTARLCINNSACQWTYSTPRCYPPQPRCERITDFSTCNDTVGCDWQPVDREYCQFPDCEMNLTSVCENNLTSDCESNLTSICEKQAGCQLVGDLCTVINSTSCNSKNKTECQDSPDEGCSWVRDESGSCFYSYTTGCGKIPQEECENKSLSLGCEWHISAGFCDMKVCQANDNGTDCDIDSVAAGCKWEPPTQREYCSAIYSLSCKDNVEKNGCDVSSQTGCVWKSPDYCRPDSELKCYVDSDSTDCDSASKAVGCTWQTLVGSCHINKELQCHNNLENTGCDTEASAPGCVWVSATEASCGAIDDMCVSNKDNTTCSDASQSKGCEWVEDVDEVVDNAVSISLMPTVILFALIGLLL